MFDVLVIGGGPAGITAAIYAKRAGRNVAILEKIALGGQLNIIGKIENYPGFAEIMGPALADEFSKHIESLDIPVIYDDVLNVNLEGEQKVVYGANGDYNAFAIVFALGSNYRELKIDGEKKFVGSGVSYCAVCDGRFFKAKKVAVIGSDDSAFADALYLSSIAKEVHLFSKKELKLHNYTFFDAEEKGNIFLHQNSVAKKIDGDLNVQSLVFEIEGHKEKIGVDGVFVSVGRKPSTGMLRGKIRLNKNGYIKTDEKMRTNIEGVFACGDITDPAIRQISVAVGQGAVAGTEASRFALKKLFDKKSR